MHAAVLLWMLFIQQASWLSSVALLKTKQKQNESTKKSSDIYFS